MTKRFRAVVVVGPTASGKTALAHGIAESFERLGTGAELVNLDAFQFYRGVDAGTAKPSVAERERYFYHCLDFLEPHENIDAAHYAAKADACCAAIVERGRVPICVGGSGLYLRAFLHGLDDLPKAHEPIRRFLRVCAANQGWPALHSWLRELDPVRAEELHPNDGVRIERAIEVFLLTGKRMSELRTRTEKLEAQSVRFPCFVVHQDADDALLRQRILQRLPLMLALGWREEVETLWARYGDPLSGFASMRAIGYPEVLECVRAGVPVSTEVVERIATATWQYARRQRTWNAKERRDASCLAERPECFEEVATRVRRWWDEGL